MSEASNTDKLVSQSQDLDRVISYNSLLKLFIFEEATELAYNIQLDCNVRSGQNKFSGQAHSLKTSLGSNKHRYSLNHDYNVF